MGIKTNKKRNPFIVKFMFVFFLEEVNFFERNECKFISPSRVWTVES